MVYSLFLGMILNKKRDRAILESESNMNLYKLNIPYIYIFIFITYLAVQTFDSPCWTGDLDEIKPNISYTNRRKFRSLTSDNMDSWKSRAE